NVGKSTLINTLTGSKKAKTGDEAGITKLEQRIVLADDFYLYDTPGMLWPRIIVAKSGFNLAASGAIGRNAFDDEEVALELLAYLKAHYASAVATRFKLDLSAEELAALKDEELLEAIGRKRGAILGKGRITLETPEEFAQWLTQGQQLDAERQLKKDARGSKPTPQRQADADGGAGGTGSVKTK
ncbi:MAG: ribosome biogenesis GTPase YlqF, partial [Comamonadaceae bacterium]